MFNRLQVQDGLHTSKKRKVSKTALLKQAEAQVATGDGEAPSEKVLTGTAHMRRCQKCNCLRSVVLQVSEQSWKKVMHLAKGEKILDDPNRLRRSIKKEAKDKQKKAKEWQERNDAVQKKKVQRQEKYAPNASLCISGLWWVVCEVLHPGGHNASLFADGRRICSSGSTKNRPRRRQSERLVSWGLGLRAGRRLCVELALRDSDAELDVACLIRTCTC